MGMHQIQDQSRPQGADTTGIGADEDDFHSFGRLKAQLDSGDQKDEKRRKQAGLRVGALSGKIQLTGKPSPSNTVAQKHAKKVVYF
jgi:zinc finger CCHC domain-containing protein 9